jgi:hypothetical protein
VWTLPVIGDRRGRVTARAAHSARRRLAWIGDGTDGGLREALAA